MVGERTRPIEVPLRTGTQNVAFVVRDQIRWSTILVLAMRVALELLRCPVDAQPLHRDGQSLVCESGAHRYPVVDGVPVLIDDETSVFSASEVAESATVSRRPGLLERIARRIRPAPEDNPGAAARFVRFRDLLVEVSGGPTARVLVVGGGTLGRGMAVIAEDPRLAFVGTDVYLGERVDVACDAHRLPFESGSFDGVIVQAVLEHVASPPEVVAEIHRVLRDDGVVYAETPFLQGVHEGAYDFTRYTDLGHRRLFRMFEEIERGVAVGPASSLFWALRYFVRAVPREGGAVARILDFAVSSTMFWLIGLDRRMIGHQGASDGACGLFFVGRRRDAPISDREIIAQYRGIGPAAMERGLPFVANPAAQA
jgi:SAM-dependent methyltransferase